MTFLVRCRLHAEPILSEKPDFKLSACVDAPRQDSSSAAANAAAAAAATVAISDDEAEGPRAEADVAAAVAN
jgi:hypothetical protein